LLSFDREPNDIGNLQLQEKEELRLEVLDLLHHLSWHPVSF
jgi:hypothetical protein